MTNPFEETIAVAKRRHRTIMLVGSLIAMICVLGVGGIFAYSRGVAIDVRPDEAVSLSRLSVSNGLALAAGGSIYSAGGDVTITVSSPGFRDATRRLSSEVSGKKVVVELRPLPGELLASTTPEDERTRWSIDGAALEAGPTLTAELKAGTYILGVDNPFFEPAESQVVMRRGETTHASVALTPVAGRMLIDSVPGDAAVLIGGEAAGTTPLDIPKAGGTYDISVHLDGYAPSEETVQVTNDASLVERTYRLKPLTGSLTVSVEPAGGVLLVDGRKIDPGERLSLNIDREHSISYEVPGYHTSKQSVRLAAGEEKNLNIRLKVALGEVAISSEPAADIYIDNVPKGRTPATLELPARPAKLTLRREGYRTIEQTVRPKAGAKITVGHTLTTEREAILAEAPSTYENGLDMTFKLFGPASYTMGAPRHQKGQRANEFLRDVKLTRHFYAGVHEITNAQYKAFDADHRSSGGPDHPVVNVSWVDAARFCNWLSENEGLAPFYKISNGRFVGIDRDATGYRLLSEAEWEYLARLAGRKSIVVFPWGDTTTIPKNAGNIADENAQGTAPTYIPNYNDGFNSTAPVGTFAAEPSGLHDLTGNVSEWVHDLYSLKPPELGQVFVDPLGARVGDIHVFKGSSFRSGDRTTLRASYREGFAGGRNDLGFRTGRYLYGENDAAN